MGASNDNGAIKTVAVFCGSKDGANPLYREHATELGRLLGEAGYTGIYGGGGSGLMGAFARGMVAAGGKVKGVITEAFRDAAWYAPVPGVDEIVVKELPLRKSEIIDQADAVVVLPGGIGTLDEQWEVAARLDMEICAGSRALVKPIIVLSTNGYYNHMKEQMKLAVAEGFIHPGREKVIKSVATPEEVAGVLAAWNRKGLPRACEIAPLHANPAVLPSSAAETIPPPKAAP